MNSLKKFMKSSFFLSLIFAAVLSITPLQAQEEESVILSFTEFTIKPGHNYQFREGIKAWKECYLSNGGEWNWSIWNRVQGKGNVYALTSTMEKWAEMDEVDDAGKECRDLARELINPHIESVEYNLYKTMPQFSSTAEVDNKIVWVTYWTVENSTVFMETVENVSGALKKAEGDSRGYWYRTLGGGPDSPHFFVVEAFENWAALDVEEDGVWEVVEKTEGEKTKDELRNKMRSSTDEVWSYIYERQDELSNRSED